VSFQRKKRASFQRKKKSFRNCVSHKNSQTLIFFCEMKKTPRQKKRVIAKRPSIQKSATKKRKSTEKRPKAIISLIQKVPTLDESIFITLKLFEAHRPNVRCVNCTGDDASVWPYVFIDKNNITGTMCICEKCANLPPESILAISNTPKRKLIKFPCDHLLY